LKKMKVAVIGLGVMGLQHARIYSEMPYAELVGVYDINQEHSTNIGQMYGVKSVVNVEDIFNIPGLDGVSICTSDDQHYKLALMACDYGKHVLIEKPLATDLRESAEIMQKANQSGIKMMVGHTLRWDPRYYLAREAVRQGKVGTPLHVYARRNNSYQNALRLKGRTSVLMFLGVHDLDAIEWVTGDKIVEVYCVEVRKQLDIFGVGDAVLSTLRLSSGAVGNYETSWVLPDHHLSIDAKLDITGTEGAINIDIIKQNLSVHYDTRFSFPDTAYGVEMYGRLTGILKEEITSFVLAVMDNQPLPISVEEAHRSVYIASCMEQSLLTGLPVAVGQGNTLQGGI
jgi:predicted dehydrogenase